MGHPAVVTGGVRKARVERLSARLGLGGGEEVIKPDGTLPLLFGEGGEAGFVDLQDDAGVAVGYFADVVFRCGA